MRVHISYLQGAYLRDYEKTYVPMFGGELQRYGAGSGFVLESNPRKADIIIIWEGFEYKTPSYIDLLENDPLIRDHAERVYTINYDDHPEGFLAGVYTSLERPFFDPIIHRIWPFFLMNNPRVYDLERHDVIRFDPRLLFSFRGAASHAVRKRLFVHYPAPTAVFHIEHVKRWYDHADDDRLAFARLALDSTFCLCPRGYCAYTPRITEIMAMARVPVIIADDWIPFSFGETSPYYVKVAEAEIDQLPDILNAHKSNAEARRLQARALWDQHCAPSRRVVSTVECIRQLAESRGEKLKFNDYRERWRSPSFLRQLGWTARQRALLRLEQHVRRRIPNARIPGVSDLIRYRNAPNLK